MLTVIGVVLGVLVSAAFFRSAVAGAYLSGKRAGFREAAGIAADRAACAATLAPHEETGAEWRAGMIRAQVAHAISLDLLHEASQVRP